MNLLRVLIRKAGVDSSLTLQGQEVSVVTDQSDGGVSHLLAKSDILGLTYLL
jgi:hypothetical protein